MKGQALPSLLLPRLLQAWNCAPRASQGYLVHFLVYCGRAFPEGGWPKATSGIMLPTVQIRVEVPGSQKEEPQGTVGWGNQDPVETLLCFGRLREVKKAVLLPTGLP